MSAAGRWFATPHAVRRFARHAFGWRGDDGEPMPEALYRRVLGEIVRESMGAHFVRRYARRADQEEADQEEADLWRGPKPRRLRYVVATRLHEGGSLPSLLTVLPQCDERRSIPRVRIAP